MSADPRATVHYTAKLPDHVEHGEYVGFSADPTLHDPQLPTLVDVRVPREVLLHDARAQNFTLAHHGFELHRWPTRVRDFSDSPAVLRNYIPEVEDLVSVAMRAATFCAARCDNRSFWGGERQVKCV